MISQRKELEYFFSPRSIAIVGASGNFDIISGKPLRLLREQGYQGEIYPVNPKYEELGGYRCYRSIGEVPGPVDHALIAVNFRLVLPVLRECAEKKVKFATVFASGFAETGEEGKEMQKEIARLARETGMGICGPNCQGSANLKEKAILGFSASLGVKPLLVGPIGYVTQSGALGYSIFSLAQELGVGFTFIASTGNEVDLHTLDFLEYMLEDSDTKMIISYLEGIKDGRQFARLADRALDLGKPIVSLKVGRSEIGQKAASSHTASLTGSDAVTDAFFRQKGIIRVNDIENMIDIAALMQRIPGLPEGAGLGVITTSGGGGILVADEAVEMGLDIPELGEKTTEAITAVIPAYGSALNPVDITAQVINEAEDFMKVLRAMVDNPRIHGLVIVITQITGEPGKQMARDIVKMSGETQKPITVAWTTSDQMVGDNLEVLEKGKVQYYKSPVRAVRALGSLMNYSTFRQKILDRKERYSQAGIPGDARERALSLLEASETTLTEAQSKQLLSLYGIEITREVVAHSEDEAVRIARDVGFPLALKIDSPDILHKTEAGGLKLGITNEEDLLTAHREILDNARSYRPDARIGGVLIQEMVMNGTEVIVGVNNDPVFGPTVMFGLGGIFVEILKDVTMRVAPVSTDEAREMIEEIKGYGILAGARGREKADVGAIAETIARVSLLAVELEDHLSELDINPLLALAEGGGVRVADALVIRKRTR